MASKLSYDVVSNWTVDDVADWVSTIGVHEAESYVISNEVDGRTLLQLDEKKIKSNIRLSDKKLKIFVDAIRDFQKMPPPLKPRSQNNNDEDFDDSFDDDDDAVYDNDPTQAVSPPPRTGSRDILPNPGQSAPPIPPYNQSSMPSSEYDAEYLDPNETIPHSQPVRIQPQNPSKSPQTITGRAQRQPPIPPTPPPATNSVYEESIRPENPIIGRAPPNQKSLPQPLPSSRPNPKRPVLKPPSAEEGDEMYVEPDEETKNIARGRGHPSAPSGKALPPPPPIEEDVYEETDEPVTNDKPTPRSNQPTPLTGRNRPIPPPPTTVNQIEEECYEVPEEETHKSPSLSDQRYKIPHPSYEEDPYEEFDNIPKKKKVPTATLR